MDILNHLLILSEEKYSLDFFHSMTKLSRIFAGYPQEYGFHHGDKKDHYGIFVTRDCRGKVFKFSNKDKSAVYTCKCDKENLIDKYERHMQILEAVKASSPPGWNFVSMKTFNKSDDPCFAVEHSLNEGDIDIFVNVDFHPSIKL